MVPGLVWRVMNSSPSRVKPDTDWLYVRLPMLKVGPTEPHESVVIWCPSSDLQQQRMHEREALAAAPSLARVLEAQWEIGEGYSAVVAFVDTSESDDGHRSGWR